MNPQACEEYLRQWFDRLWNQGDLAAADTLCRKQVVLHFPEWQHLIGVQGYKDYVTFARNLFPNLHVHIQEMVIEGDHVAVRYSWVGTYAGGQTPLGVGRSGAEVAMQGIAIYHLVENQIAVGWAIEDWLSVYQQLGIVSAREAQVA